MAEREDMSTPVTRGELKAELAEFKTELKTELKTEFRTEMREALEIWGGALLARIQGVEQQGGALLDRMQGVEQRMTALEDRLLAEMARHATAVMEAMAAAVRVVDDRYRELPGRVTRLEHTVFKPKRRRARC